MRYLPSASVTTTCSPWSAGEVAETTTSASGLFVSMLMTMPTKVAVCAAAADDRLEITMTPVARSIRFRCMLAIPTEGPGRLAEAVGSPEKGRNLSTTLLS
jgi:hypothetical protein